MTTPTYKHLTEELQPVRFYTEKDPYHYTVDNRPIQDLNGNFATLSSAADAGRRASLISSLDISATNVGMFGEGGARILGLDPVEVDADSVRLTPGVMFEFRALNGSDNSQVMKVASSHTSMALSTPRPNVIGNEVYHLVQIRYVDGGSGSEGPYEDSSNEFLPSTLLNGKLEVNVVSGVEGVIEAALVPSPTEGWLPLYVVKKIYGDNTSYISRHEASPGLALIPENRLQIEKPYDVGFFINGVQPENTVAFKLVFARTVIFEDLSSCYLYAGVPSTAEAVYSIRKNGDPIGSITVPAESDRGEFLAEISSVFFEPGDCLEVVTPTTADETLADVAITLVGYRGVAPLVIDLPQ